MPGSRTGRSAHRPGDGCAGPADRSGEGGFSLPELMVSVIILGIFAGVVASALFMVIRVADPTADRVEASFGPRFSALYWQPDVASSEIVNPPGATCGTGTVLVSLRWTDDRTGTNVASWSTQGPAPETALVRTLCRGGTQVHRAEVASAIVAAGTTARCDGTACGTGVTPATLTLDVETREGLRFTVRATRRVS